MTHPIDYLFVYFSSNVNKCTKVHNGTKVKVPMFLRLCSQMYKHSNNKTMTSGAIAAMLSTVLYGRRFFPYYVYNIIGGLDEEGMGPFYKCMLNTIPSVH